MPGSVTPSYCTQFRNFCSKVSAAEHAGVSLATLDAARHVLADRADWLHSRQLRRWHPRRAIEVRECQASYDAIVGRMLSMGWR